MITKIIVKFSFFVALVAVLYCLVAGISFTESMLRGLFVFAGFYLVLIVFFVGVRFVLTASPKKTVVPKAVEQPEKAAEEVEGE